jgi:hypothetical protein
MTDERTYRPGALLELAQELSEAIDQIEVLDSNKLRHVLERYDVLARLASTVNAIKKKVDGEKKGAQQLVILTLEEEELEGAPVTIDGEKLQFSKYEFTAGQITDRKAFEEWAAQEDSESFFEPAPRVRGELLNALVKQRLDDGEPLPPGVSTYVETRLSRTSRGKEGS